MLILNNLKYIVKTLFYFFLGEKQQIVKKNAHI